MNRAASPSAARAGSGDAVWALQILRFVAASMVLVSHLNHEVSQRPALARGFAPFGGGGGSMCSS